MESFIYSNFNFLQFCFAASNSKIESIQKRALRFLYNDDTSDYAVLLQKAKKGNYGSQTIAKYSETEVLKTMNNLKPIINKGPFQYSKPNEKKAKKNRRLKM